MWFFWCFQGPVTFSLSQQLVFIGRPDRVNNKKKSFRTECTPEELDETIIIRLLTLGYKEKKKKKKKTNTVGKALGQIN